jgi:tetratricopeptide (TPR) repeat protein
LALARQVGDPILIGKAQWSFGLDQRFKDPQRAVESFQEALRLVQDMDSPEARELAAVVFLDLSVTRLVMGRLRQAQATMDEATARLRALDNRPLLADTLGGGAWIRQMRGEAAEARARTAEGLRISHEIGNPWGVVYNESVLQMIETDAGHLEQVLSAAADLLARAHTVGFPGFVGMNLMITSRAWLEAGQFERGLAVAQAYETAHQGTEALWRTINAGTLGRALMAKGDLEGAGAVLEPLWREGEDASDRMEGLTFAGPAIADWALESGRLDHGLRFCNWLVGFFEAEEGKRVAGELRYYRGRIHRALGDLEAAEADLSRARELLVRAEADILVWRVDAGLADLFQARGQAGQAAEHRRQAVERVQQLASGIADPQLRASFLARPDVQKLLG